MELHSEPSIKLETPTSTLFVAELPFNIQEAELIAAFSSYEGFQSARLRKDKNNNIVGFVEFNDPSFAARAKERAQGYKFDIADKGITVQFAHKTPTRHPSNPPNATITNVNRKREEVPRLNNPSVTSPNPNNSNSINATPVNAPIPVASPSPPGANNNNANGNALTGTNGKNPNRKGNAAHGMLPELPPFYSTLPTTLAYPFPNNLFSSVFPSLPVDASATLYIEGLPLDASEREAAHIFRQWPGYQSIRILQKEVKQYPSRAYNLCFVEFDNKYQATMAMHHLQGYRFDKNDSKGLTITYAKTERKDKRKGLVPKE